VNTNVIKAIKALINMESKKEDSSNKEGVSL
jgi:hypothetical protein